MLTAGFDDAAPGPLVPRLSRRVGAALIGGPLVEALPRLGQQLDPGLQRGRLVRR